MNVNLYHALGFAAGIAVTLLVFLLIRRLWLGKWRVRCDYDERQKAAQGVAFRNAFWTMVVYLLLGWVLTLCDVSIASNPIFLLGGALLGILVFAVSCILLDAYMGLSDNPRRWIITTAVLVLVDLVCAVFIKQDGSSNWLAVLLCTFVLATVLITFCVRALPRRGQEEDEA